MNYYFSQLISIGTNLSIKIGKLGTAFWNSKRFLGRGLNANRSKMVEASIMRGLADNLIKYNYLSYPGYSSTDTTGTYTSSDGTDYDATINTLLIGRAGEKLRYKVCYTYSVDEVETVTCIYKDTDTYIANNCNVSCSNKDKLANNINVFSNPINY